MCAWKPSPGPILTILRLYAVAAAAIFRRRAQDCAARIAALEGERKSLHAALKESKAMQQKFQALRDSKFVRARARAGGRRGRGRGRCERVEPARPV